MSDTIGPDGLSHKRRMIRKYVREGEITPWGYGLSWWDPVWPRAVMHPIPLNILLGLAYRLLQRVVAGVRPGVVVLAYERGRADGYQQGKSAAEDSIARAIMRGDRL